MSRAGSKPPSAHDVAQKRLVTHARQALLFLIRGQARQVIDPAGLELDDLFARRLG